MSGSRLDLNVTLAAKEAEAVPLGRDEKAALKRAEEAERAFRASKGYERSFTTPRPACVSRRSADPFADVDDKVLHVGDDGPHAETAPVPELIDGELGDIHRIEV